MMGKEVSGAFRILVLASLGANLVMGLMLGGCVGDKSGGSAQSAPVEDSSLIQLRKVAMRMGVEVDAKAEAVDIATAIILAINEADVGSVPRPISEKASRASVSALSKEEGDLLLRQQAFIQTLQEKRVLALPVSKESSLASGTVEK